MTQHAEYGHIPVLRDLMVDMLAPKVEAMGQDAVILDATLGAGGHAERILERFPKATLIGLDRDAASLQDATERLRRFGSRFLGIHTRFDAYRERCCALAEQGVPQAELAVTHKFSGALFDLGVSSMQLDQVDRGFAYRTDAPLDMRMDPTTGITAADVLNTYSHGDLARVLKHYGDERFAGKIASAVLRERERAPFERSARLVELLYSTIPAAARRSGGHPAKRTFQALRIEVNKELESIEQALPRVTADLAPGGRAVFMSYQSLEDKLVKRTFAELTTSKAPPGLPVELPEMRPKFRLVHKGALQASEEERAANPRAASVRVRAIEALDESNEADESALQRISTHRSTHH